MCPYSYLDIFQSLLTPLIAIVTVYIAWQQWQTNRKKLYIDLYDRRLRIYTEVKNFLRAITGDSKIDTNELLIFYNSVSEADFLFGPKISNYINEIYKHAVALRRWNSEYRDLTQPIPEGYDHKKVCDGMNTELMWLSNQFEPAREKFRKYLSLDDNCIICIEHNVRRFVYHVCESRKGRST